MLLLSRFKISGHSMEPTIHQGQTVLTSSIPYFFSKPKIGDIVVFKKEPVFAKASAGKGKVFIKRIAKINENEYFLKGDNDKDSLDSRRFGWILKKDIIGKVIL